MSSTFSFPSPQDSPGFLFWRASGAWQRTIRESLDDLDLTHLQFVLLAVTAWSSEDEGSPTQREIGELAGSDPNTTSDTIKRLERKGLLSRKPHPDDARARSIALTPQGYDLLALAAPLVEQADRAFFQLPATNDLLERLARLSSAIARDGATR